jgi:hypothetical protein
MFSHTFCQKCSARPVISPCSSKEGGAVTVFVPRPGGSHLQLGCRPSCSQPRFAPSFQSAPLGHEQHRKWYQGAASPIQESPHWSRGAPAAEDRIIEWCRTRRGRRISNLRFIELEPRGQPRIPIERSNWSRGAPAAGSDLPAKKERVAANALRQTGPFAISSFSRRGN